MKRAESHCGVVFGCYFYTVIYNLKCLLMLNFKDLTRNAGIRQVPTVDVFSLVQRCVRIFLEPSGFAHLQVEIGENRKP
jgi:hypothetical protein